MNVIGSGMVGVRSDENGVNQNRQLGFHTCKKYGYGYYILRMQSPNSDSRCSSELNPSRRHAVLCTNDRT
jgi:hypothetical protein